MIVLDCLNGQFTCRTDPADIYTATGVCVPLENICNGVDDCPDTDPDATDETNCGTPAEVASCEDRGFKVCKDSATGNGLCIPRDKFCDNIKDCPDGSDEIYCQSCNDLQFRCDNGQCIYRTQICDGVQDCDDNSDEKDTNSGGLCPTTACSPQTGNTRQIPCLETATAVTTCVLVQQFCLHLGQLGTACPVLSLNYGCNPCSLQNWHRCYDGKSCVSREKLCDGVNDCEDGSDEHVNGLCARANSCTNDQLPCLDVPDPDTCIDKSAICTTGNQDHAGCTEDYYGNEFFNQLYCGPVYKSSDPGSDCHSSCDYCIDFGTSSGLEKKCVCPDGETHPYDGTSFPGSFDNTQCDPKCEVSASICGTGALSCFGTTTQHSCICKPGYYLCDPLTATPMCSERDCEYDSDCGKGKCIFITQSANPTFPEEFLDKQCLCDPGYLQPASGTKDCGTKQSECDDTVLSTCGQDFVDHAREDRADDCSGTTCDCKDEFTKGSDGFCYERTEACIDGDCGLVDTGSSNYEAMGICSGTKTNFTCECCKLVVSGDEVIFANPLFKDGGIDTHTCDYPCNVANCGRGAFSCNGTIGRYHCNCTADYETLENDPTKCYYKCSSSSPIEIIHEICGVYSTGCTDTLYENDPLFCVCDGESEMVNGKCQPKCLASIVECCGIGAVNCNGSLTSATCLCADGYEINDGSGKCVEKSCTDRPTNPCSNGNCKGGYWSWTCDCNAGYTFDVNQRVCKGCDFTQCGSGYVNGEFTYFASSCSSDDDAFPRITCNCKKGFECDSTNLCTRAPCEDIQCNLKLDAYLLDENESNLTTFGKCYGDYFNFTCQCNDLFFEPVNFPLNDGTYKQLCAPVDCSKSARSLCGDHGYCIGYLQKYQCVCGNGYKEVDKLCVPDNCLEAKLCGEAGVTGCRFGEADQSGSYLDSKLICECDTFGYTTADNGSLCIEALCDESTAIDTCGEGATGCTGTILKPVCQCDREKHYYPAYNFTKCESSCQHNEEVVSTCGTGNICHGTFKDYTCVCQAFGFTANIDDQKRCDQMDCSVATETLTALDVAIRVCGPGALGCFGSWVTPRCTCNINDGYVTSTDLSSCVRDTCSHNEKVHKKCRISDGNSCFGSFYDATCDCKAKGFKQNLDATACEEIPCNADIDGLEYNDIAVMACGKGALSCSGTVINPYCVCDINSFYFPGPLAKSCEIGDCRANGKIRDSCKMDATGNTCQGPENNFICLCKGKGYENNPGNPTICREIDCANTISICGEGASKCSGTILKPVCECNMYSHVPALDGKSCISKEDTGCALDETIRERCKVSYGNICHGSISHFVCICKEHGFIQNGATECVEIECNTQNTINVCGVGAIGCTGTVNNPKCQCDETKNYMATTDLRKCDKAKCDTNSLIMQRCGPGNTCIGTVEDYECVCKAKGFMRNPSDKTYCTEVACSETMEDAISVCGTGALRCIGLVRSPTCVCDFENGYVTSSRGTSCIAAECFHNPLVSKQCGYGNSCTGTFKSFACICKAKGYETDSKDPTKCNLVYCTESTDFVKVCGEGAVGCEGPLTNPICKCDNENFFVSSDDGSRCEIADCSSHPDSIKCGPGRPCKGTVASFQCRCNAEGYEYVPGDMKQCRETACTSENVIKVCGIGAVDCGGTVNQPQCVCDVKNNYVAIDSNTRCVIANCENNREALARCGPGNSCEGTFTSSRCVCKAKGFTNNPDDPTECKEVMCSEITDYTSVCGVGAIGCEGSTRAPSCLCDIEKSYVTSVDGYSCVLAGCEANKMVQERCGKGNKCKGSYKYFSCLCTSKGYEPDPMDITKCVQRHCDSNNAVDVCGDGTTSCSGPITAPICECNTVGYMPSGDRHSCQPQPCRFNKQINCLDSNECSGTYFSPVCLCKAPHYMTDPDNPLTCLYAPCNVESCGGDARQGANGLFATSCEGTHIAPICHCKEGFEGTGTSLCTPLPCSANPLATCQDNGVCNGTFFSWTCKCDAPDYVQHKRDPKQCVEAPCNVVSCGRTVRDGVTYNHAAMCQGSEKERQCKCYSGHTGMDTPYCKPLPCADNPLATCSNQGKCKGDYFEWTCVCTKPDFIQNPTNPNECIPAPCIKERCGKKLVRNSNVAIYFAYDCEGTTIEPKCMCKDEYDGTGGPYCNRATCSSDNAVEVCGKGATDCKGYKDKPICKCDESRKYHTNEDASRCILSNCENHPDFKHCGPGNKCKGTIDSFQCVYSADGWENVPDNVKMCKEIQCTQELAETACGSGALDCSGTFLQPKCICDTTKNFVSHPTTKKCVEASCENSKDFAQRCGLENSCSGSIDSYICNCNSKGFQFDPDNVNNCKEVMCEEILDYASVCGNGALACTGPTRNPICECDIENNFISSPDGHSCIAATCKHNIDAVKSCGNENQCVGTFKDYTCVCNGVGYEPDPKSLKHCMLRECNNNIAKQICGDGATGCGGMVLNPICECNTEGYVVAGDKHSCKPLDCKFDKELNCGAGNTCSGTYFSSSCVCNGPIYMTDKMNPKQCLQAPCKIEECGRDEVSGGGIVLFAEKCLGTYMNPECDCKIGYKGTGTPYCTPRDCKENPMVNCGEGGQCKGTFFKWQCVCLGPKYIQDVFDPEKCVLAPCQLESCGHEKKDGSIYYFATSCNGYHYERKCQCKEGYEGQDTPYCKPKDCTANPLAHCNYKGRCKGSYINWICVCDQPMFMQDAVNPKICIDAPCKVANCNHGLVKGFHVNFAEKCEGTYNETSCICKKEFIGTGTSSCKIAYANPSTDPVTYCGNGATSIEGPLTEPICYCDESRDFISSKDGHSCLLAECSNNEEAKNCGPGNKCFGTVRSFQCICEAEGWKIDPYDTRSCIEVECDKGMAVKVCGYGATGCKGTKNQPICECDIEQGYVLNEEGKCELAHCSSSLEIVKNCGYENKCVGTIKSYTCQCTRKGYEPLEDDKTSCHEVMCDEVYDVREVCGDGALSCEGSTRSPRCICDEENDYITSEDGLSCIPATCEHNVEMQKKCGKGNKCMGTYKIFSCLCTTYGYEPHPTDKTQCVQKLCTEELAQEVCGDGATGCGGTLINPICECKEEGYMMAGDKHTCQPMDCKYNEELQCGEGNSCKGTYFSAVCICNAPSHIPDKENSQKCKEAKCDHKLCGMVMHDGIPHYYAEDCTGTYSNRKCICRGGYNGTNTPYCKPESCNENNAMVCGGTTGRCKGTVDNWSCVCDSPTYMLDPTNNKMCIEAPCKVEQCGFGYINNEKTNFAVKCKGTYKKPTCYCREHGFILKNGTCTIDPNCTNSVKGRFCNSRGKCIGDYFHFECQCRAPEYEPVKDDMQTCDKAPCDLKQCGTTKDRNGNLFFHATKCFGTFKKFSCNCKEGYYTSPDTAECVPADCSTLKNVCNGNGKCNGTTMDYVCTCFDHYDNPDNDMTSCKEADCATHDDVCGGHGVCKGTFSVFDCICHPGYEQKRYENGIPTCVKASCKDSQCGGTNSYPFGLCGDGYFDNYTCACYSEKGYTHPVLPSGKQLFTECGVKCDSTQCGKIGVRTCSGTRDAYICDCEKDFIHPKDSSGIEDKTTCVAKCTDDQCGGTMQKPYGNCTGTKTQFKCDCNHDYSHPVDSDLLEPIEAKCRASCDHKQCGFTHGKLHGQCKGSNISFICECHRGFDHPHDIAGNPILSQCQDVNECKISDNLCDKNADCINIPGGFKCKCHENFVGEGFKEKGCYPNGGWDVWQHHDCSVSCGGGFMKKSRDCLVPLQYRTKDICEGEEVEDNIPCNNFPCQGLCLRRKCNCKQAIPYINKYLPKEKRRSYESYAKHENNHHTSYGDYKRDLENFNSNDDDADIFEDVKQFKFEDASLLLAKFVQLTSKNLCIENEFGTLDGIMNDVNKDMQMVRDSIEEFRKKKYEIQIVISCNENPYIVDELFRSYRSLTEHMFLTKLMMEDLMNQKKKIMTEISKCKREQSFDLGDMMGMIG